MSDTTSEELTELEVLRVEQCVEFIGQKAKLLMEINSCEDEVRKLYLERSLARCKRAHQRFLDIIDSRLSQMRVSNIM